METRIETKEAAKRLGLLLKDHKGGNVVVLDITGRNSWADFFVIATATSTAHSRGLVKFVHESLKELGLELHPAKRKIPDGDEWVLIDLGPIVVHLMSDTARSFYDLEKLWYGAPDLLSQ